MSRRSNNQPQWEFPKIRGTLFWVPYNKDPTIQGTMATVSGWRVEGLRVYVGFRALGFRVSGFRVQGLGT